MPECLETISVALNEGAVTLDWSTREELLGHRQHVNESASLRSMFTAVGATRPVG